MLQRNLVAGLVILLGMASAGSAATVTFAQFQQQDPALNAFQFSNSNAGVRQFTASVPVLFSYSGSLFPSLGSLGLLGAKNALLTLTASTTAPASISGTGTSSSPRVFTQPLQSAVLAVSLVTPVNGLSNLLTATFTDDLSGVRGGSTANLRSDTSTGDTLVYSSDFVDFSRTLQRDLSISFTSLTSPGAGQSGPDYAGTGLRLRRDAGNDNFLRSFTAAGVGTFASDPSPIAFVPEPASSVLVGFGLIVLATFGRRYC